MSLARRLIAAGFSDLEKGERFLAARELQGLDPDRLFAGLQMAASPDTALQSLVRLIEKHPALRELAAADGASPDSEAPHAASKHPKLNEPNRPPSTRNRPGAIDIRKLMETSGGGRASRSSLPRGRFLSLDELGGGRRQSS